MSLSFEPLQNQAIKSFRRERSRTIFTNQDSWSRSQMLHRQYVSNYPLQTHLYTSCSYKQMGSFGIIWERHEVLSDWALKLSIAKSA